VETFINSKQEQKRQLPGSIGARICDDFPHDNVLTLCFTQFLSLIFDFVLSWFSAFFLKL
jgi:hypothetical protein